MFAFCSDLEYINIKKINYIIEEYDEYLFGETAQNLIIWSENDNDILLDLLEEKIIEE